MEASDGDAIGFGHDNHAPKDRGYQTGPIMAHARAVATNVRALAT